MRLRSAEGIAVNAADVIVTDPRVRAQPVMTTADFTTGGALCDDPEGRLHRAAADVRMRLQATLKAIKLELRRRMHQPLPELGHYPLKSAWKDSVTWLG